MGPLIIIIILIMLLGAGSAKAGTMAKTDQLSRHFKRGEVDPHGEAPPHVVEAYRKTLAQLDVVRDFTSAPIYVTPNGGFHGPTVEKKGIQRPAGSRHRDPTTRPHGQQSGMAVDFYAKSTPPEVLYDICEGLIAEGRMKNGGLGLYKTFVHYDDGAPRRWRGEGTKRFPDLALLDGADDGDGSGLGVA